ncbi:MAG: hypothetical protein ACLU2K_12590 [Clostridia bacterium]
MFDVPYYSAIMTLPRPTYAPDIGIYADRCISRRRHTKRRMRQYGRA